MLEARIRHHVSWAIVLACGALGARALIEKPAAPRVVTVQAPPTVIAIAVPAPPPPAPPPPPPAAPPVIPDCPDVSTVGVPVARVHADINAPGIAEVAVSREGCVIAARTETTLWVSWDAGQTFRHIEQPGITAMIAVADRVVLQFSNGKVSTLGPDMAFTDIAFPATIASSPVMVADGHWIGLLNEGLVAVTDDDGAHWRYIEPLPKMTVRRIAKGYLIGAVASITSDDGMGDVHYASTTYTGDLRTPRWKAGATYPGSAIDEEARFSLDLDKFWGCGSSQKLLDTATGTEHAGDLRDDVYPIEVHTNRVTFARINEHLVRLDGKGEDLGDIPGSLVGVDAAGTAIVKTETQVLRWSKAGGRRVLL
jgi:hypothetical protein